MNILRCERSTIAHNSHSPQVEKGLTMITAIFNTIKDAITGFTSALGDVFDGLQGLFVDTSAASPSLTFFGTLLLIAAGVGIVYWAFRMIKGLVQRA